MEVKRERTENAAPPSAASVSAVLGNDDLLREILLRISFPTTLVRAALVAKRWLCHVSDPAFLRCSRERHPPALLGFYVSQLVLPRPQFVPVSQSPELDTAICRASFIGGPYRYVEDCRNGRGVVRLSISTIDSSVFHPLAVLDLLQSKGGVVLIPPPPPDFDADGIFLPEDGDEGGEGVVAVDLLTDTEITVYAEVYTYQSGVWTNRTTPAVELPEPSEWHIGVVCNNTPPAHGKIYMSIDSGCILVLDLLAMSLSVLQLPNGVNVTNLKLLCGEEDSGLFLIQAEEFLLSVRHHQANGNGAHCWVLLHSKICVHEACNRHEDVTVMGVDDNLEFVILWLKASELLMHINLRSGTEKVYDELTVHDKDYIHIKPLMMVWPPIFPALREENKLEE